MIIQIFKKIGVFLKALWGVRVLRYMLVIFISWNGGALKGKLKAYMHVYDDSQEIVKEVAKQPKNTVKNVISEVKVKDGSTLDFAPKNKIEDNDIINNDIDSEKEEVKVLSKREIRKLRKAKNKKERKARKLARKVKKTAIN